MSDLSARGRTYARIHDGGKWLSTHTYTTEVNGFLNACAASAHCNLGNDTVGYLALTAQPASFLIASPTSFGQTGQSWCVGTGRPPHRQRAVIGSLTRQRTEDTIVFNEYHSVDRACKKVLCKVIPEAYLRSFKNKYTGYATLQCLKNSVTLMEYVRGITRLQSARKLCKDEKVISSETLFEEFVEQIETAVNCSSNSSPLQKAEDREYCFHNSGERRDLL